MELNAVVTVHNRRVLFTTLFSVRHIFSIFFFFLEREQRKKEQINSAIGPMIRCLMFMIVTETLGWGLGREEGGKKIMKEGL